MNCISQTHPNILIPEIKDILFNKGFDYDIKD
jgi:hypothetical protein